MKRKTIREIMKTNYLNKLAEISLNIADIVDEDGKNNTISSYADTLGYGYLALSRYLRDGVKAIADIQMECSKAKANEALAKISETEMKDFLFDIFGDSEIHTLNDEYKNRIKDFVSSLMIEIDSVTKDGE